jgi:serine/threonine protein kinase
LADFGLALLAEKLSSSRGVSSSSSSSKGTLQWLAPEILVPSRSKKEYDARKRDIYAFACSALEVGPLVAQLENIYQLILVAYQMYTGRPPFGDMNDSEVIHKVIMKKEQPPLPPNPSPELKQLWPILKKCLAQDPRLRPTVTDIAGHLTKITLQSTDTANITRSRSESILSPLSSRLGQLRRGKKENALPAHDAKACMLSQSPMGLQK